MKESSGPGKKASKPSDKAEYVMRWSTEESFDVLVSSDALAGFSHEAGVPSRQTEPQTDTQAVSAAVGTTSARRQVLSIPESVMPV